MARRILLIARDMVGDLVNTTGAVAWLLERFPQDRFILEGGPAASELFPRIEVWTRKRHPGLLGKLERLRRYRAGRFDAALILDDSREKIRLATLAGIPIVIGAARNPAQIGQADVLRFDPAGHDLFPTLEAVVAKFTGESPRLAPVLPIEESDRGRARGLVDEATVVLHVGASDIAKCWPVERWIDLGKRIGCPAVVASGPGEEAWRDAVATASGLPSLPALTILEYAAVIERAHAIVTADTAPAHLAGAVGTRAVILYGPTDPSRFHPWGDRWRALRHDLGCEHYGGGCRFQAGGTCSQRCMGAITAAEVLDALAR